MALWRPFVLSGALRAAAVCGSAQDKEVRQLARQRCRCRQFCHATLGSASIARPPPIPTADPRQRSNVSPLLQSPASATNLRSRYAMQQRSARHRHLSGLPGFAEAARFSCRKYQLLFTERRPKPSESIASWRKSSRHPEPLACGDARSANAMASASGAS